MSPMRCTQSHCGFLVRRGAVGAKRIFLQYYTSKFSVPRAEIVPNETLEMPSTPQSGFLMNNATCFVLVGRSSIVAACPSLADASIRYSSINIPFPDGFRKCTKIPLWNNTRISDGMLTVQCDDAILQVPTMRQSTNLPRAFMTTSTSWRGFGQGGHYRSTLLLVANVSSRAVYVKSFSDTAALS